jgi:hypothetical protein
MTLEPKDNKYLICGLGYCIAFLKTVNCHITLCTYIPRCNSLYAFSAPYKQILPHTHNVLWICRKLQAVCSPSPSNVQWFNRRYLLNTPTRRNHTELGQNNELAINHE